MNTLTYEELKKENQEIKERNDRLRYLLTDREKDIDFYRFQLNSIRTIMEFSSFSYEELKKGWKTDGEIISILFSWEWKNNEK